MIAVYLFGSRAAGTAGPDSDVDVGVIYTEAPEPKLCRRRFSTAPGSASVSAARWIWSQ